jgi:riboflavin synthase
MFTGLVRTIGTISSLEERAELRRIAIACDLDARDLELGASVCCAGVCLTVVEAGAGRFAVQAGFETLRRTTLGRLAVGDAINLEPSLRVGDALGGHFVFGHVDGLGTVRSALRRDSSCALWIDLPAELLRLCAPRGSIAIEGTSLTIAAIDARGAMIMVIPHTLEVTTLGRLQSGDPVNVEADMLARYVARLLAPKSEAGPGVTWQTLVEAGFAEEPKP